MRRRPSIGACKNCSSERIGLEALEGAIAEVSNRVHVLLFDAGSEAEGIHSLELNGHTVVLLFEEEDDALRYALLLEAQDFPEACVEAIPREDIEYFCAEAGYEARYVPSGFCLKPQKIACCSPPQSTTSTPTAGRRALQMKPFQRLSLSLQPVNRLIWRPFAAPWRVCCEQPPGQLRPGPSTYRTAQSR